MAAAATDAEAEYELDTLPASWTEQRCARTRNHRVVWHKGKASKFNGDMALAAASVEAVQPTIWRVHGFAHEPGLEGEVELDFDYIAHCLPLGDRHAVRCLGVLIARLAADGAMLRAAEKEVAAAAAAAKKKQQRALTTRQRRYWRAGRYSMRQRRAKGSHSGGSGGGGGKEREREGGGGGGGGGGCGKEEEGERKGGGRFRRPQQRTSTTDLLDFSFVGGVLAGCWGTSDNGDGGGCGAGRRTLCNCRNDW